MSALSLPIATALRQTLRNGYTAETFKHDLTAALIVSLVALPLSMALSIAVGLPPQHGLYTAIVAGIAAALLGGSMTQVSGPTAAFVAIVAPIVAQYGLHGILWCQIMAGAMLIALGFSRMGRYVNYVPYPVTTGFTAGIAVVIGTLALNDFLGLGIEKLEGHYLDKLLAIVRAVPGLNPAEAAVGIVSFLVIATFSRITRVIPAPVAGVFVGTLLGAALSHYGFDVATINSRFTYDLPGGGTGHGIPPWPPSFHIPGLSADPLYSLPSFAEFQILLGPAFVIAALGALESLLSATVADSMAGTRHDPNAELSGIGVGNILCGMAGGIPATGAIARTAMNINSGGRTPVSSALHAVFILIYVLALAGAIGFIPMASLAALLLMTAWRMSHAHQFVNIVKMAPRSDTIVLLACFVLTVFIDMVAGVTAGIVLAALLFMKRIAEITHVRLEPANGEGAGPAEATPEDIMLFRIEGPLFFGSVEKAYDRAGFIQSYHKVVIDMEKVPVIDMSGLAAIESLLTSMARRKRHVALVGHRIVLHKIVHKLPEPFRPFVNCYDTLEEAVAGLENPAA